MGQPGEKKAQGKHYCFLLRSQAVNTVPTTTFLVSKRLLSVCFLALLEQVALEALGDRG